MQPIAGPRHAPSHVARSRSRERAIAPHGAAVCVSRRVPVEPQRGRTCPRDAPADLEPATRNPLKAADRPLPRAQPSRCPSLPRGPQRDNTKFRRSMDRSSRPPLRRHPLGLHPLRGDRLRPADPGRLRRPGALRPAPGSGLATRSWASRGHTSGRLCRLGPPKELESEIPPRFAQALGSLGLGIAVVAFIVGVPLLGWLLTIAVAACRLFSVLPLLPRLQALLPALVRGRVSSSASPASAFAR